MKKGDRTEIGESGETISGGQNAAVGGAVILLALSLHPC